MIAGPGTMAEVAALVGDPARAIMLDQLMGGRALTATELALCAGVAPPTASGHLAKLVGANLLAVLKCGRHRDYRLASPRVARMLEGIMEVAAIEMPPRYRPRTPRDEALCLARTCYDHLAGRLSIAITDALVGRGVIAMTEEGATLADRDSPLLAACGIDVAVLQASSKRPVCRSCLDWTERRLHLSGAFGSALARRSFELGWLARRRDSRALVVTDAGREGLHRIFGVDCDALAASLGDAATRVATRSSAA